MNNMSQIMKQAKAMQDKMSEIQKKIENMESEGTSGGGAVKVVMNGKHEIKKINIDPSLLDDKEILEDMIAVAFKDALKKIEATSNQKMGGLMPPGMNLPI